jgi:hypothetical protein
VGEGVGGDHAGVVRPPEHDRPVDADGRPHRLEVGDLGVEAGVGAGDLVGATAPPDVVEDDRPRRSREVGEVGVVARDGHDHDGRPGPDHPDAQLDARSDR